MRLKEFIDEIRDFEIDNDLFNPKITFKIKGKVYSDIVVTKTEDEEMQILLDNDLFW